jgi:hypothetical protein
MGAEAAAAEAKAENCKNDLREVPGIREALGM